MNDSRIRFDGEDLLKHTPLVQQILLIHRTDLFIGVAERPNEKTNWCYWQNHFVAITCRCENHEWEPRQITIYKDDVSFRAWLSDQLVLRTEEGLSTLRANHG